MNEELVEANRLEQELIEAGNREADRYYAEWAAEEEGPNEVNPGKV